MYKFDYVQVSSIAEICLKRCGKSNETARAGISFLESLQMAVHPVWICTRILHPEYVCHARRDVLRRKETSDIDLCLRFFMADW